jgi:hypothetical protein
MSLNKLGQELGYENGSRISEYLTGKRVAGPRIVRKLAVAIGASPIEALWLSEHGEAILDEVFALTRLGWSWCREDNAWLVSSGAFFSAEAIRDKKDTTQATRDGEDPTEVPSHIAHRYHRATLYNTQTDDPTIRQKITLPRPLAVAIFLATGLFPRRGDEWKPETRGFLDGLLSVSGPMLKLSDELSPETLSAELPVPLQSAQTTFDQPGLSRIGRAAAVAEYTHGWVDGICESYARYARLAMFERGGVMADVEDDPWEYLRADVPEAAELALSTR